MQLGEAGQGEEGVQLGTAEQGEKEQPGAAECSRIGSWWSSRCSMVQWGEEEGSSRKQKGSEAAGCSRAGMRGEQLGTAGGSRIRRGEQQGAAE